MPHPVDGRRRGYSGHGALPRASRGMGELPRLPRRRRSCAAPSTWARPCRTVAALLRDGRSRDRGPNRDRGRHGRDGPLGTEALDAGALAVCTNGSRRTTRKTARRCREPSPTNPSCAGSPQHSAALVRGCCRSRVRLPWATSSTRRSTSSTCSARLSIETGRPVLFSLTEVNQSPDFWRARARPRREVQRQRRAPRGADARSTDRARGRLGHLQPVRRSPDLRRHRRAVRRRAHVAVA